MDTNLVLIVNIALISLSILIFVRPLELSWIVIHGAIIGAAAIAYMYSLEGAGYALLAVFIIFVILPLTLRAVSARLSLIGRAKGAEFTGLLAVLLHPAKSWRFHIILQKALAAPSREEQCRAMEQLELLATGDRQLHLRLLRLTYMEEWAAILALPKPTGTAGHIVPLYNLIRIRALGALGRLEEMAECYFSTKNILKRAYLREMALMWVLTWSGKYNNLEALFAPPRRASLQALDADGKQWLIQLARLIAGEDNARPILEDIASRRRDPMRRLQAMKQLATPLPSPNNLSVDYSSRIDKETADILSQTSLRRITPVTIVLIICNLLSYAWQFSTGNPTSVVDLVAAGGMWPRYVLAGDWWRIATALFLHADWLHLSFNMMTLYALGTLVERRIGSWRTAFIYGVGGLASSAAVYWMMVEGIIVKAVLVGASGAIMSLFGALVFQLVVEWFRTRTDESRTAFLGLIYVIAIQVVADFAVPKVSFAAHASGFFSGIVLSAILILLRR